MHVDLTDQVAIVTGGATGIGRAIASVLARNRARVVIVDVDGEHARSTSNEISAQGQSCVALTADVAESGQMAQIAEHVLNQFGRVDILINNAGINMLRDRA